MKTQLSTRSATSTCSTARSAGSPTAASPTSTRSSRALEGTRAAQGHHLLRRRPQHARRLGRQERKQDGPARVQHHRRHLRGRQAHRRRTSSATRARASRSRCSTFDRTRPWIARRRRRHHPPRARRVPRTTRSSARPSACPSRSTRRCSSCWPRWPSPTSRRACCATRRPGRSTRASHRQHRLELRQGLRRRRGDAGRHRRRADLRRLRLHQGVPGREADARRQAAADLRGHARSSAWSSRGTSWATGRADFFRPSVSENPLPPVCGGERVRVRGADERRAPHFHSRTSSPRPSPPRGRGGEEEGSLLPD